MEEPSTSKQKVFIFSGIAIFIILFTGLYLLIRKTSLHQQQTIPSSGQIPSKNTNFSASPTPQSTASWKEYKGDSFLLQYPSDWRVTEQKKGEVDETIFAPVASQFPNFSVQVTATTIITYEQLKQIYDKRSYYSGPCKLRQTACIFYIGRERVTQGKDAYLISAFTEWNEKIYLLKYVYLDKNQEKKEEQMMNAILKTFLFR